MEKMTLDQIEKQVSIRIILEDLESIYSIMMTENNSIFCMAMVPYYSLFVQSVQEFIGENYLTDSNNKIIKDIRNHLKFYGDSFGKTKNKILSVDDEQNKYFSGLINNDSVKREYLYTNLGSYWTSDKHIVGNTQLYADYLGIEDLSNPKLGEKFRDLASQLGSFVSNIKLGFQESIYHPKIIRREKNIEIKYFADINSNKNSFFMKKIPKEINILWMHLLCNMNFIKFILRSMFSDNKWVFRVEYIVTYYTYKALIKLHNYNEQNNLNLDLKMNQIIIKKGKELFQSRFRNCMMHYGLVNRDVLSIKNIKNDFYGILETCYGMSYKTYLYNLRQFSEIIIAYLESKFDFAQIDLEVL